MAGYIAITTSEWIENIKSLNTETAVFWSKKASFKALNKDEPFYFLRRGSFASNADRYIVGRGFFSKFERLDPQIAWTLYEKTLGFNTKGDFERMISSLYRGEIREIGCTVLEGIQFFLTERSLEDCSIDFSPYIVSGKRLSSSDCARIENAYKE